MPSYIECPVCKKSFLKRSSINKYCSKVCREKDYRSSYNHFSGTMSFDYDKSRGSKISEGMAISKNIKTCSIECLLDELGDLE